MVTNDGATILRSIIVDNPAAKVLVDIAKTQDDEVGDGTTSVTVLAGELLREAEKLINQRIHPMVIIEGWRRATQVARAALEASSLDHSADADLFRLDLLNIARTTLSSKLLTHEKDQFAHLAVDAVMRIRDSLSLEAIQIIKKTGGSLKVGGCAWRPLPLLFIEPFFRASFLCRTRTSRTALSSTSGWASGSPSASSMRASSSRTHLWTRTR